ncbi:MltR family transcriptional regulator [Flavobacterium sp. ASW18X]|uniref:MltR family transcriptional regulator n=1 Tax=Flavobacterium sp. ASW18X TaxID=2572595 RepID=UPI0010AE1171|nr:MltR family transcriptional regulator [Flavobacterium sp. ASW18X]TKD61910.1 hypothetical protein FBT53_11060 [Flavobacterium sp. ASW18X]
MFTTEQQKEREENISTLKKVRNELNNETDRGCCLVATSYLDFELERMLKKKLVGSNKHLKSLFEFSGPLGTFSSKINLSYSLGFISKTSLTDLHTIRKIRNDFGHSYESLSFETESVRQRINLLKSNFYTPGEIRPRGVFTNTVYGIMAEIHVAGLLDNKFQEKEDGFITDPESKKKIKETAKKLTEELSNLIMQIKEEDEKEKESKSKKTATNNE